MEKTVDFAIFGDNILFLRRLAGMGRVRFSRLLTISVGELRAIEQKREDARISITMLSRLRLLLGETAQYLFLCRFE